MCAKGKERLRLFANTIHEHNVFEYLTIRLRDKPVNLHADSFNCKEKGWSHGIAINREIKLGNQVFQLFIMATGRASIASHIERRNLYLPIVKHVAQYRESLPPRRKDVTKALLHTSKDHLSHAKPKTALAHSSRMAIYVSSVAFMIDIIWDHFNIPANASTGHNLVNMLLVAFILTENPVYFWEFGKKS
jgi:hypothetical protein